MVTPLGSVNVLILIQSETLICPGVPLIPAGTVTLLDVPSHSLKFTVTGDALRLDSVKFLAHSAQVNGELHPEDTSVIELPASEAHNKEPVSVTVVVLATILTQLPVTV